MKNHKQITELVKSISGQANILTIPRVYLDLLEGIQQAVEIEEKLRWLLIAAQARIDVFKVESYTNNKLDKNTA